jgi:hypothetical protein
MYISLVQNVCSILSIKNTNFIHRITPYDITSKVLLYNKKNFESSMLCNLILTKFRILNFHNPEPKTNYQIS